LLEKFNLSRRTLAAQDCPKRLDLPNSKLHPFTSYLILSEFTYLAATKYRAISKNS
jgi:hypothetical protein